MIKVNNIINVYELMEDKEKYVPDNEIVIKSHQNENDKVIICVSNKEYTVNDGDLKSAIDNATHINRW